VLHRRRGANDAEGAAMTFLQTTIRLASPAVATRSRLLLGTGKRVCCVAGRVIVSDLASVASRLLRIEARRAAEAP
jgi:hypothetical protein